MKANIHHDFDRNRLSTHFVYESYDETNQLFFNRGSIGFVLKGWPLVGASMQEQGEISEFLKEEDNLPQGAAFQVMMIGTSHIDGYLNYWRSVREGEIFQKLAKRRTDFLKKIAVDSGTIKDVYLLIAITIPTKSANAEMIAEMQRRREVLSTTLHSIGLATNVVNSSELLEILRLFFGWEIHAQPPYNPYDLIAEQILSGDFQMDVTPDQLIIQGDESEICHKAYSKAEVICTKNENKKNSAQQSHANPFAIVAIESAKRPKNWQLSMMDLFIGNEMRRGEQIHSDFIQSFSLQILPKQAWEVSNAIAKRESLLKNMRSGLAKWLPNLDDEYEDMDKAVVSLQQGDRMVLLQQNVILKDRLDKIRERTHGYRSMMRRNGFYFVPCTADHLPVVLSCLPMQGVEAL